jgi:ketosteroid isomerase-like protein
MSSNATVERVREAYRLIRRGDPRQLLDFIAPNAVWDGTECKNGEHVAKTLLWRGALHRLRATSFLDVGDRVVVTVSGTRMNRLGAPWWGWRIYHVVTVRDGRIVRIQDFGRRADAFAEVGLKV